MWHTGCDDGGKRPLFSFCVTSDLIPIPAPVSSGLNLNILDPRFSGPYHDMGAEAKIENLSPFFKPSGEESHGII